MGPTTLKTDEDIGRHTPCVCGESMCGDTCDLFKVEMAPTPKEFSFGNGMADRSVGLVKTALMAIRIKCRDISDERATIRASTSRNLPPNGRIGLSPCQILSGRSYILESMGARMLMKESEDDEMLSSQKQLAAINEARIKATEADSKYIIEAGMKRPPRAHAEKQIFPNDMVVVFRRIGEEP